MFESVCEGEFLNMRQERKKFASQVNVMLLQKMHDIAQIEGRQFQSILEEAFDLYIQSKENNSPRKNVMTHFKASLEKNRKLGELLAK